MEAAKVMEARKCLFIVTSETEVPGYPDKTGSWFEELAAPYYLMKEAGLDVVIASPKGGAAPIDAKSLDEQWMTDFTRKFDADEEAKTALGNTKVLSTLKPTDFSVVFLVGGHGGYVDFVGSADLDKLVEDSYVNGGVVVAVCHGPMGLVGVKDGNGELLVKGKKVTGFTNDEETQIGSKDTVPFTIEDKMTELGANFCKKDAWTPHVVSDGRLVTGQQNLSASLCAAEAIKILNEGEKN